jgi:transposase
MVDIKKIDLSSLQTWVILRVFNKRFNTEPQPRRQVMTKRIKYIGMDVHKKSIAIAIADSGRQQEVRFYGNIANRLDVLDKIIRKFISDGSELRFVYEAGPCGYQIYRHLTQKGFECMVAAPSQIPKKSGQRIKNDRRDAIDLARLYRAGELTAVYVPHVEDEAIRDLSRAREDAKFATRKAKQQLSGFLLRHGHIYAGRSNWSKAHFNWIADITLPHPGQQLTLQEYVDTVRSGCERVERITQQLEKVTEDWRMLPVVKALQAMRGVSFIVAVTTVAELGDLGRFDHPQQLMAYLGLILSENSTGEKVKRGAITKTGNGHVRRVLVEAAQAYRLPARVSRALLKRHDGLPPQVLEIAWKAQLRLCQRYRRLIGRGKPKNVVVTSIARELIAFMWAIAKQVQPAL